MEGLRYRRYYAGLCEDNSEQRGQILPLMAFHKQEGRLHCEFQFL